MLLEPTSDPISEILADTGLKPVDDGRSLNDRLDISGLTIDSLLGQLSALINTGDNALQLRAIELTAKLRGLLRDTAPPPASIIIQIIDPSAKKTLHRGINPILIPRDIPLDPPMDANDGAVSAV